MLKNSSELVVLNAFFDHTTEYANVPGDSKAIGLQSLVGFVLCLGHLLKQWSHIEWQEGDTVILAQVAGMEHNGIGDVLPILVDALVEGCQLVAFARLHLNGYDIVATGD